MDSKPNAMEQKGDAMSVGSTAAQSVLELNGLKYRIPQPLSTGVMRTYKREYAARQSYTQGTPVLFDWNTGTSYVEPQSALLNFDLVIYQASGGNSTYRWGSGLGGCSLFNEIRIISKNGVEVDRTQEAHLLAKVRADYTISKETRRNLEMCDGYSATSAGIQTISGVETIVPLSIPLKLLSGFFRPTVEGMLIPAGLASGLRIEMMLENFNRSFQQSVGAPSATARYEVRNPEILLQLTDLNDPVQSALMKDSALSGLEYTFPSYFATVSNNNNSSVITEQIKKAVSQCCRIFTCVVDKGAYDVADVQADGFASIRPDRVRDYQIRVGSSYYPQQLVTRRTEFWALANAAFDMLRRLEYQPNQVNYADFETGGRMLLGTSLETNDRLNLSGLPINNSSVAEFRLSLQAGTDLAGNTAATDPVDAVIYLEFISVCKTNINRSTLRI